MKYLLLILFVIIQGCAQSTVGGSKHKVSGVEVESRDYCMGNCLAKTVDGLSCSKFSKEMAEICKGYLHD